MKSSANCYNSKELLESFNDILFITQTLIINITRNEDKLKKISTPAEENWFKIAEEWEKEDK